MARGRTRPRSLLGLRLLVDPQRRDECLLRDVDATNPAHPLLALLLLLEQLALAGDVAAVALGEHVLALGLHGLAGHDARTDRGLDRDVEQLPRDQLAQASDHLPSVLRSLLAMYDARERIDGLAVQEDVDPDQLCRLVPDRLVVE